MLFDALDSYLSAKERESKLQKQMGASPNDMRNMESRLPELQKLQATTNQNFLQHLGTTLGARMLGKTGLDAFGVGQDNQAIQNAMQYQQMQRPQMLNSGTVNPPGLQGPLNAQMKTNGDGKSLMKMLAKMMMGA